MLFTELDAEEVLAFLEIESETCPGCGFPTAETHDADNAGAYEGVTTQCAACAARHAAEKKLDANAFGGVYSYARKRPPKPPRAARKR